jgi:flagellum-specific ATP synthase
VNTSGLDPSGVSTTALPRALRTMLDEATRLAAHAQPLATHGRLLRAAGLVLEASGLRLPVGAICRVESGLDGEQAVEAEVVGFGADRLFLMPTGQVTGLSPGSRVSPIDAPVRPPKLGQASHPWRRSTDRMRHLPIGTGLLGRVVDACGVPIDRGPLLDEVRNEPIQSRPISAMDREPVRVPLDTGVRAINALLTVGRGQRLGLFAGAGVGKSVLLGMMARFTAADVIVVGLIGERGREVKEFIEDILGEDGRRRSVVVAAPADCPPLLRMQGANYATAIAEHFRDQGLHVLLLMDSLTRYAMAAREIALAIGEPPATKGYPPSVFAKLPLLVERAGNGRDGHGSITAFYTVLAEGDDQTDPIADAARSFLDGHFVLTRALAEGGHYPAIDIEQSISRVMHNVATEGHVAMARRAKAMWSRYQRSRDLISVGAYVPGNDPETDQSIALFPRIARMLQQSMNERSPLGESLRGLEGALGAAQA